MYIQIRLTVRHMWISVGVGLFRTAKFHSKRNKMDGYDDFEKPDREGFMALLSEPIVYYKGMLFRKGSLEPELIDRRLKIKSPEEVQRELNHTHLFLYAVDLSTQRNWAQGLERHWLRRFASEFPKLRVHIEREDNGEEVIVTFWTGTKEGMS
jgi:hypothetical protein